MYKAAFFALFLVCANTAFAQCAVTSIPAPKEVTEQLWMSAVQGDLLTQSGWQKVANSYFVEKVPFPTDKMIHVVSNEWGLPGEEIQGDHATVYMGFEDAGFIDSDLRFVPPKATAAIKTFMSYRLELVPTYIVVFGSDGKTEVSRKPTGCRVWKIKDPEGPGIQRLPWTTVNTAIRYVLEARANTRDERIIKNAGETLQKLLLLH